MVCPKCGCFEAVKVREYQLKKGKPKTVRWRCEHCQNQYSLKEKATNGNR